MNKLQNLVDARPSIELETNTATSLYWYMYSAENDRSFFRHCGSCYRWPNPEYDDRNPIIQRTFVVDYWTIQLRREVFVVVGP